mmetsp:Transcript_30483/g.47149  ORF Transcript_30483/g.47149 Transcript_30483/m.47149 type:complete len:118 (+) Transcript_30483:1248-1601(+)
MEPRNCLGEEARGRNCRGEEARGTTFACVGVARDKAFDRGEEARNRVFDRGEEARDAAFDRGEEPFSHMEELFGCGEDARDGGESGREEEARAGFFVFLEWKGLVSCRRSCRDLGRP